MLVRLFGIFEKMQVGKKREDFSGKPCYNGSVEVRDRGQLTVDNCQLRSLEGDHGQAEEALQREYYR